MSQRPRWASNVFVEPRGARAVAQHRRLLLGELRVGADDAELHGGGRGDRTHAKAAAAAEERARALAVDGLERERRARRALRVEVDEQRPLSAERQRTGDVDRGRGLADTALAIDDRDDLHQVIRG